MGSVVSHIPRMFPCNQDMPKIDQCYLYFSFALLVIFMVGNCLHLTMSQNGIESAGLWAYICNIIGIIWTALFIIYFGSKYYLIPVPAEGECGVDTTFFWVKFAGLVIMAISSILQLVCFDLGIYAKTGTGERAADPARPCGLDIKDKCPASILPAGKMKLSEAQHVSSCSCQPCKKEERPVGGTGLLYRCATGKIIYRT